MRHEQARLGLKHTCLTPSVSNSFNSSTPVYSSLNRFNIFVSVHYCYSIIWLLYGQCEPLSSIHASSILDATVPAICYLPVFASTSVTSTLLVRRLDYQWSRVYLRVGILLTRSSFILDKFIYMYSCRITLTCNDTVY